MGRESKSLVGIIILYNKSLLDHTTIYTTMRAEQTVTVDVVGSGGGRMNGFRTVSVEGYVAE